MGKFKKYNIPFFTVISIISIIFLIIDPEKLSKNWKLFVSITGIVIAYIQFLIKNSTKVYFWVNDKYRKFFVHTVSWSSKYKVFTDNIQTINDFKTVKEEFEIRLKKDKNIYDYRILTDDDSVLQINLNYKGRSRVLKISFYTGQKPYMTFAYSSSLSYKDSIQEFESFEIFLNHLKELTILDSKETRKNLYEVKIFLEQWNPFYKMIISHMIDETIESYEIKITDVDKEGNSAKINIMKNSLKITSESPAYIKRAVKDYLILSNTD